MKATKRFAIFIGLLLVINAVAFATFSVNLRIGAYPVDADSIGIPIMETLATSLIALVASALLCVATGLPSLFRKAHESRPLAIAFGGVLILLYLAVLLFYALWAFTWADGNHWPIALSVIAAILATVNMSRHDFKQFAR